MGSTTGGATRSAGDSRPSPLPRRFAAAAGALLLLLAVAAGAVLLRGRAAGPPRSVSAAESALRVALPPGLPRALHSVLPDVFLLGEPKTGSTFLWRCLGDAEYFAAGKRLGLPWFPGPADGLEKEIFFWGGPFGGVQAALKAAQAAGVEDAAALSLEEALAWNGVVRREVERGVFGEHGIGVGAVLSDFTPTYLHDLAAANRVQDVYTGRPAPPAFIVVFRDPLERAFSNWSLYRRFHKSMGGWEVSARPRREGQTPDQHWTVQANANFTEKLIATHDLYTRCKASWPDPAVAADDYNFQRELHCLSDPIGPAAHKDVAGKRAGYYSYSAPYYHMKHWMDTLFPDSKFLLIRSEKLFNTDADELVSVLANFLEVVSTHAVRREGAATDK